MRTSRGQVDLEFMEQLVEVAGNVTVITEGDPVTDPSLLLT